ncbi:MAG: alpha/beta hydrolase, partial [Candidatus Odinarchaeota archaeon]
MVKKSFIDNPIVSNQVFFPRKIPEPSNIDSNIKVLKFEISKKIVIGGLFYLNKTDLPNVLLFHGNGEIAADYQYFLDFFFDCGVNLGVVDFRGYGFSTGEPIYSSLISDALPIYNKFYEWITSNNLNNSVFLLGRSLGSVCAAEIGAHNPISLRGIIFESGFASMYNIMTKLFRVNGPDITLEGLSEYSNDTKIRQFQKPVLIIHGTQDWIIPCEEGKLIYENVPDGIEKNLVLIEGAGQVSVSQYNGEPAVVIGGESEAENSRQDKARSAG